jgi:hypothetical protein
MLDPRGCSPYRGDVKHPASEFLGTVSGPDGQTYSLHFYGEDEGAAAILGPTPMDAPRTPTPTVYRTAAQNRDDARDKLAGWRRASGWPM